MKVVIQRVSRCSLWMDGKLFSSIAEGLLVLLGIGEGDSAKDWQWLSGKIAGLRIFSDDAGKMNLSVKEVDGAIMLVSQFTLLGNVYKGNRPSFIEAAGSEVARPLYEAMIQQLSIDLGKPVATGVFGADMQIELINNGPVTILLDSKARS